MEVDFWSEFFTNDLQQYNGVSDFRNTKVENKKYDDFLISYNKEKIDSCNKILELKNKETLFLYVFLLLLKRYGRQDNITIGYVKDFDSIYPFNWKFNLEKNLKDDLIEFDKFLSEFNTNKKTNLSKYIEIEQLECFFDVLFEKSCNNTKDYKIKLLIEEDVV